MKFTNKLLSIVLALVMLFGAVGFSSAESLVAKSVAASTKTVAFKKRTLKLKSVTTTVNGPKITWNKLTGANKYYIYRKTPSTSWKKIATVKNSVTSYTDKSVKNKVAKYSYTVKGADKKGVVSQYNKNGLTIYFVKSPVLGDAVNVTNNGIKFTWTKVNNATGYYVYRKKAGGKFAKIATVKNGKTVSYTDKSSKANNTVYYYTVKAYKTVSGKTYSSAYNTTGKNVRFLKAPELKKATLSGNDYMITWKAVSGATDYVIYRSNNLKNPQWEKLGTTDTLRFRDKNVRGKTYLYTVRALRNSIKGSYNSKGIKVYYKAQAVDVPVTTVPSIGGNTSDTTDSTNNFILENPLEAYRMASKEIHEKGKAGYKKISWQAIEEDIQLSKFDFLKGTLSSLVEGFLTNQEEAEVKDSLKGSDDAMMRMPAGDCSESYIKSVKAVKKGNNYVITIVMKNQVNPSYADKDGLALMSKEFLDMKDVVDVVENDATVSRIVSKVDGTITYKDYTITATMNSKGQFIKIKHYGVGYIDADITAVAVGDVDATSAFSFNGEYYDFVY